MQSPFPSPIRLGLEELVPDRPFTDPHNSRADMTVLEYMRQRLRETLLEADIGPFTVARELYIQHLPEPDQRLHRVVLLDRASLLNGTHFTVVGFFGQRNGNANPLLLQDVDTELMHEFLNHPYVLSYSSLELGDSNWANLVIMQHVDGIQHWRNSQKHAFAARELAPQYYLGIRLHNGLLPQGLHSPAVVLHATNYYDFTQGTWLAIRDERARYESSV